LRRFSGGFNLKLPPDKKILNLAQNKRIQLKYAKNDITFLSD
jgi:hypothetical protein